MNRLTIFLLIIFSCLSLFLNLYNYKKDVSPPCFNADEAALGYNTYSIATTGRDEYGSPLPLRLKSFGDYKMPLYSYLSVPFIGLFGLNETTTRLLNTILSFFFPIVIFFLTLELFKNRRAALTSSFLVSISLGLQIIGRHAHEAYLAVFLLSLTTLFFLRSLNKKNLLNYSFFSILLLLSLFSYQSSRIYAVFFLFAAIIYQIYQKKLKTVFLIFLILIISFFTLTDFIYKPERVKNLLFINNIGFSLKINELISENNNRLLYNKATIGFKDFIFEHIKYFSPQFLITEGDNNPRFGFKGGISPLTPIEYLFFFIGLYFLFKNNERYKYFIILLVAITPITASLSWNGVSLTRSLFLLIPLLIISSYGLINMYKKTNRSRNIYFIIIFLSFSFFLFYNWDFYLNHYSKRALVKQAWQCGYKELANYIAQTYKSFDKFYITKKHGQPYIFLLFYQKYPPAKYQKIAELSPPDEYGFGQVDAFDKFIFDFKIPINEKGYVAIGYPDDFTSRPDNEKIPESKIKKIVFNNQDIFWIYENP